MTQKTTAVLLAAGAGTRLGRGPKALLPYRGGTLAQHAAAVLLAGGCSEVVVVLGSGAAEVRAAGLPAGCRAMDNPRWAEGMGTSFAAGVAAALAPAGGAGPDNQPTPDNVLVALVDQPGMGSELVARLIAVHKEGRITAAGFRSDDGGLVRGHPVLFDADLAAQAAATASGDAGARIFLRGHPELVDLVDCSDLSDGADVDTPAQLHLLD
ncbi:nucleotidyltransferase family protein [Arthrobacter sp. 35W]|uniref:nucleotidyltransferase family protein n=1 Tax=Arthrobacter sp. 35W TaxID=1132441 RepID=UPI00047D5713|nr:nucleotidyltransferase family protein [Arthrobacter sp. 35W]